MCFAESHVIKMSRNTGETRSKPLSKSRCVLKLLTAVTHGGLHNHGLGYFYLIQEGVDGGRFTESDPTR
jgi:hypothetical protein